MNFTKKVFDSRMERTLEELQDERAIAIDSQIERDFTLTEEPLCNFASHNVEMMRGNLECSLLDYLFFSNRNIKIIQNMIRKTVFDISKYSTKYKVKINKGYSFFPSEKSDETHIDPFFIYKT